MKIETIARRRETAWRNDSHPSLTFQVVLGVLTGKKTEGTVAKVYGVHPKSVSVWKETFLEKGMEVFAK